MQGAPSKLTVNIDIGIDTIALQQVTASVQLRTGIVSTVT
jgi:hypothetical protein